MHETAATILTILTDIPSENLVPVLGAHSTRQLHHKFHTSLNYRLAIEPRHRLAVTIVLPHPFLIGFVLDLPSLGW